jgi:hypothetical protein
LTQCEAASAGRTTIVLASVSTIDRIAAEIRGDPKAAKTKNPSTKGTGLDASKQQVSRGERERLFS